MTNEVEMLTIHDAETRVRIGAEDLESVINRVDRTPKKGRDEERYAKLESLLMSFLAARYGIAAPTGTQEDIYQEEED